MGDKERDLIHKEDINREGNCFVQLTNLLGDVDSVGPDWLRLCSNCLPFKGGHTWPPYLVCCHGIFDRHWAVLDLIEL